MLRRPEALERLCAALAPADRVVLLGDTLELRERPLAEVLGVVRPVFERLAPALAGKPVTLVPGNHDHQLGEPWLARERLAGRPLGSENEWRVTPGGGGGAGGGVGSWVARRGAAAGLPGPAPRRRHVRDPRPVPRPVPDRPAGGVADGLSRLPPQRALGVPLGR